MELRHLRYFIAVAEECHFRLAAERLHIAQPALSRQIQQLEAEVGALLLHRTTRRVELTDAGRVFYDRASRVLAAAAFAVDGAQRTARGEIGWLTLGFVDSAAYGLLPPLLRALRREAPGVALELRELATEPQLEALQDEIDVGIVREVERIAGLTVTRLLHEVLVAALPERHRLARRRRIGLAELADDPFVQFPRERVPLVHDHLIVICRAAGFQPRVVGHALQYATMLGLVAAEYGVALVPASVGVLRTAGVAFVPLRDPHATSQLSLAVRVGHDSPALRVFRRTARTVAAELAASRQAAVPAP